MIGQNYDNYILIFKNLNHLNTFQIILPTYSKTDQLQTKSKLIDVQTKSKETRS
jgi:hypothetical protein